MPLPPRGPRWRGRAGFALWRPLGGIARHVRAIVADPFRADPAGALSRSPTARLRDRRIALIRLILLCVVLVAGLGIVPVVMATHAPPLLLAAVAADLLLSVVCLIVNQSGFPTPAVLLFIGGAVAVGVAYTRLSPAALPRTQGIVLLIYATMSLLILLAGSVLPPVFVWLVAGLVIAVTLTGLPASVPVAGSPVSGGPGPGQGLAPAPGLTALVLLVALQAMTAVMSWAAAQSAAASAAAANAALDQARELTALKDQFLIDANHELRTPIMAWYGNTELLANFGTRATPEQRDRMLERALASGDAVLQLLDAVLDAGALGSGPPRLRLSDVPVEPLVREVLATFDPREIAEPGLEDVSYAARQVTVTIERGLTVVADPSRLRQILVNLLTNALKYSAPQTPIAISSAALPLPRTPRWHLPGRRVTPPPRMGCLSVRDEGLGVPPRDAPKLFNRFVRLERDIAGPVRGTGVGLYLCRVLTEAMGGRIWLESSGVEGEGSTFSVALPLAQPAAPAGAAPHRESAGAVSATIRATRKG